MDRWDPQAFEPEYLVMLDEIYHGHWVARRKRRILRLAEAVRHFWPDGHPTQLIQITGTNGKGSTAHYLTQGLGLAGRAGSWTGPHVFDYAERFHVNGDVADHAELVAIYRQDIEPYQRRRVLDHLENTLGFAETGILMALHLFARHQVEWAVMEVGAGGRYTPLMALPMAACVLTNIGMDHPKTLGEHAWQRALEKAGIARPEVPFFTAAQEPERAFVVRAAEAEGAPVEVVDETHVAAVHAHLQLDEALPDYQARNLALACVAVQHLYPGRSWGELLAAMEHRLPARFRQIEPNIIVDVAHNHDKMAGLAERLRLCFPERRFHFLVGLSRSRDAAHVFAPILELAASVMVTGASYVGQDPYEIADLLREAFPAVVVEPEPRDAYRRARSELGEGELLIVTGSAYTIDQALNSNPFIAYTNASYGRRRGEGLV